IVLVLTKDLNLAAISQPLPYVDGTMSVFNQNIFSASWQEVLSGLAWGLGYFGMPHILVRFMGIKHSKMIKTSATVAISWVVLTLGAAIALAYFGRMVYGAELLVDGNQKLIFIKAVRDLFPAFIAGILLSAIIAAAMSTADSQLLVASSSFTSDIYKPVIRKKASDKEMLWVGRGVVMVIAVAAYFIASNGGKGAQAIMNMVENAWGGFGAAFGPVILFSLFWKRLTYKGAIAGVIGGAVTDVVWLLVLTEKTGIYELLPGFLVGAVCCIVVSLIDKAPDRAVADLFERATSKDVTE
ncbi:MAG: sodium:proline symporter, partial [Eubacteriales bacterium]|nr:sodium:proline symporter [Eubacteriales bacterium]